MISMSTARTLVLCAWAVQAMAVNAGPSPQVDLDCESHDQGPQLSCRVQVADAAGKPLPGVQVQLGALMPTMPMAHTIVPVQAQPTGQAGQYHGTLTLEMRGVWTVSIDLRGPVRDKVQRNLMVLACEAGKRCVAIPASAKVEQQGSTAHGHTRHAH